MGDYLHAHLTQKIKIKKIAGDLEDSWRGKLRLGSRGSGKLGIAGGSVGSGSWLTGHYRAAFALQGKCGRRLKISLPSD